MKRRWVCEAIEIKQNEHLVAEAEMKDRLQKIWELLLALNVKRASRVQQSATTLVVSGLEEGGAS